MLKETLSIFVGGNNRVVLPIYEFLPLVGFPTLLLVIIIVAKPLSNIIKQILSIPLLLSILFIPFGFTNGHRLLDLTVSVLNYNLFLRFLELYWIGPTLQHRPVYATPESLWIDLWGCMRQFPKPAKEDTQELKKGEIKQYKKDKKFYHVILYLCTHMVLVDVLGSWLCSFTGHEVVTMIQERPIQYFWYFCGCCIILNSAFNCLGYSLQLFYCIVIEHGSYSSEQWRPLMIHPVFSSSLDDLWSHRWHQLFKSTWLAFPFRPTRILSMRYLTKRVKQSKPIAFMFASISVFAASGLMHEYAVAANVGWPIYYRFFAGEQCVFFVGHGLGVLVEHLIEPKLPEQFKKSIICRVLQHVWVVLFGYYSFYYIMNGFLTWGFHLDNILTFSKPYIIAFAKSHPPLIAYFGSQI